MKTRIAKLMLLSIVFLVLISLFLATNGLQDVSSSSIGNEPYPPPEQGISNPTAPTEDIYSSYPAPVSDPPNNSSQRSMEANKAVTFLCGKYQTTEADYVLLADHVTRFPFLEKNYQAITLFDKRQNGKVYKFLVDKSSSQIIEDIDELTFAEAKAKESKLGKFDSNLFSTLSTLKANGTIPVTIWVRGLENGRTFSIEQYAEDAISEKYPEAKKAMESGRKMTDVGDLNLARKIHSDYMATLQSNIQLQVMPLVEDLKRQGYDVTLFKHIPAFAAELSKETIVELAKKDGVDKIYLANVQKKTEMDSVIPTLLVPAVWDRGIRGDGVNIGILDIGNVDPANSFLYVSPLYRPSSQGIFEHATETASTAASFHNVYTGVAPNATIVSIGESGTQADEVAALDWASYYQVNLINNSGGFEADSNMNWTDRAFDYAVRYLHLMIVKSSGNTGGYITSPGKAWNVITVGGFDDKNTSYWGDDEMWSSSSYINPTSIHGDREKPEVVAVSKDVTVLSNGNAIATNNGTSMAAPQVTGISALMMQSNPDLTFMPEAQKAILMASATHNIEGNAIITRTDGDLKDGAGGVNADLAQKVSQLRATSTYSCTTSCWWDEEINNNNFPLNSNLERLFFVPDKSYVRVAISWLSNASSMGNTDVLDTDLDLKIIDPLGYTVSGAVSASYDNNYEIVQFVAPTPGWYKVSVNKVRANEYSNFLGISAVIIPLPYDVYLPTILNN